MTEEFLNGADVGPRVVQVSAKQCRLCRMRHSRHCFATHMLDNGAELPVIQILLGHDDPRDTMIYLHLSTRKLKSAPSPLQTFDLSGQTGQEPAAS